MKLRKRDVASPQPPPLQQSPPPPQSSNSPLHAKSANNRFDDDDEGNDSSSSSHSQYSRLLLAAGSCSRPQLFFALLLSRLPILLLISTVWDMGMADYDTSSRLMPTVMVAYEDYEAGEGTQQNEEQEGDKSGEGNQSDLVNVVSFSLLSSPFFLGPSSPIPTVGEPFRALRSLRHWDAIHFTHIAHYGYSHEHLHAFFPGVPMLLRGWNVVARFIDEEVLEPFFDATTRVMSETIDAADGESPSLFDTPPRRGFQSQSTSAFSKHSSSSLSSVFVTLRNAIRYTVEDGGALLISLGAFAAAGVVLRELTSLLLRPLGGGCGGGTYSGGASALGRVLLPSSSSSRRKSAVVTTTPSTRSRRYHNVLGTVLLAYATMPAGIFTIVPYTESLFALLVMLGIYCHVKGSLTVEEGVAAAIGECCEVSRHRDGAASDDGGQTLNDKKERGRCDANPSSSPTSAFFSYHLLSCLAFFAATIVRSNGILLSAYYWHDLLFHRWRLFQRLNNTAHAAEATDAKALPMPPLYTTSGVLSGCYVERHRNYRGEENGAVGKKEERRGHYPALKPLLATCLPIRLVMAVLSTAFIALPYAMVNYIGYRDFCGGGGEEGDVTSLTSPSSSACPPHWWQFYSYIQRKYWQVYPFSAYSIKNLPNFIIPLPMVVFIVIAVMRYWRVGEGEGDGEVAGNKAQEEQRLSVEKQRQTSAKTIVGSAPVCRSLLPTPTSSTRRRPLPMGAALINALSNRLLSPRLVAVLLDPHLLCLGCMMAFAAILMHIQVMVRFLFASPAYYWVVGRLLLGRVRQATDRGGREAIDGEKNVEKVAGDDEAEVPATLDWWMAVVYLGWAVTWLVFGSVMFTNHFPWT